MHYSKNTNLRMFDFFFFFYFSIIGAYLPFFPIWSYDVSHISKGDIGIISACISLFSLLSQPIFRPLSDKPGLRKHLLWVITGMLIIPIPFLIYVLDPLLQVNILPGSTIGGIYLDFTYNTGAPTVEAYIGRASRRSNFELGRTRMLGYVDWTLYAPIIGVMFTISNQFIFRLGSSCAVILVLLLLLSRTGAPSSIEVADTVGANNSVFNLKLVPESFRQPKLWFLSLYMAGVSCTYDVSGQQFANLFTSPSAIGEQGIHVFGYVTTVGELLDASIMFSAPLVVSRIGGKNALLLTGAIMSVRTIDSSFATTVLRIVILKMLHVFEIPFLIVGRFKYITSQFEIRFSATTCLVCFCPFKQLTMIFMSILAGKMYKSIGFQRAYLVSGITAPSSMPISVLTLSGSGSFSLRHRRENIAQ